MKKISMSITLLIALFIVHPALALDVSKLCDDSALKDSDVKVYRGSLEDGKLEIALVLIETTDSGRVLGYYVYGKQPDWKIFQPGCTPGFGKMKGRTLKLNIGSASVKYKFDKSDGAKVEWRFKGSNSKASGYVELAEK